MKQLQGIFLLFVCISVYPQQDTSLILSEIMFIPPSGNNEFIEIYNSSPSETINLNGYKIKYYTAAADIITNAGWGTLLPPLSYAVVLEGDYDSTSGIYNQIIPPAALRLKISDNAFGATGMSNTADRQVQLLNPQSAVLDQRFYTADNEAGYSEEKLILNHDSIDVNWSNSEIYNGTPGKRNSISHLNYDLALFTMFTTPVVPAAGENVQISAVIKNRGMSTASLFYCSFYNDINFDSLPSAGELISQEIYYNLVSSDSIISLTELLSPNPGDYNIIAKIIFEQDEDTSNNTCLLNFTVYQENEISDIIINEIMYAPTGGMPEWVELFNRSDFVINLRNRRISDNSSSVYITRQDLFVPPDSFVVLSKDSSLLNYYTIPSHLIKLSSLPSLNNSGDDIVIRDSAGIHFDSLSYLPDWGGTSGRSLERIYSELPTNNADNWGTSEGIRKGTPGWINSLTPKQYDLKVSFFASEKSYGIIGENIAINAVVKNSGTSLSGTFIIRVYNDLNKDSAAQAGEIIISISGTPVSPYDSVSHTIIHSGFTEGYNYLIAVVEANPDEDLTNNIGYLKFTGVLINEIRNDLVINEFMYSPISPEPEWIEIYNKSSKTIEMKNYLIADSHDTVNINLDPFTLDPGEYLVVSSDSSILKFYNINSHLFAANFPSLNNTGDKIILMDSLERIIDSLEYHPSWGGAGKSVERVNINDGSTDSLNWKTSLSKYSATPGYLNSVTFKEYDITVNSLSSIPYYPALGDSVKLIAEIKNNGSSAVTFDIHLYSDTNLDSIPDLLIEKISGLFIINGDSSSYTFNHRINSLDNKYNFYIDAQTETDQDTSNNYDCILIFPGYTPGSIVINEIMYSPAGGEPEWIELFNKMDTPAEITDWVISDVYSTPVSTKLKEEILIQPKGYFIISKDSSIGNFHRVIPSGFIQADLPALNNDREGVVLTDSRGQTMDSLTFISSWGGTNGNSLERKSVNEVSTTPFNWNSSADIENSTPGRINNTALKQYDLAITGISFNPRFPVKDDDVTVAAQIKNFGQLKAQYGKVNFYLNESSSTGDSLLGSFEVNNLEPNDSLSADSPVIIRKLNTRHTVRAEITFANDEDIFNNIFETTVEPGVKAREIIINEIMYAPENGEPEWIELQNISEDSINLRDWEIEDISSGNKNIIISSDFYVKSNEYIIITSDSLFHYYHPDAEYRVITQKLISLSNTADGIVIYDFRLGIVDSVSYKSLWGGKNGYSLERISRERSSADSSNWTSCLSINKSTPGFKNSMIDIRDYCRNELVINEIMAEPDIDNCEFIELINTSGDSINIGSWRIEDEKGSWFKLSETSLIVPPHEYFILAADSIIYFKYKLNSASLINISNGSSLGLTNSGELILLKDIRGNIIDSLVYSDKWHNKSVISLKNLSLERINPLISSNEKSNWSSSVSPEKATPGLENSILCVNSNISSDITVSPNPFSPDNDGFEDHCIINYRLNSSASALRVIIFDSQGREVRTLVNNYASANTGSIIFDGCNDSGQPLRMGIYIIFIEAADGYSSSPEILKTVVVVARKLN